MAKLPAEIVGEHFAAAMGSMSLSDVARKAGLNRQQVHRYITGKAIPRADSFMSLCAALNVDPWRVFDNTDEDNYVAATPRINEDLIGNASDPSEEQFRSGVYEFYTLNRNYVDRFTRVIMLVENDGYNCLFRAITPYGMLPPETPRAYRRISGYIKVKFNRSYCMSIQSGRQRRDEEALYLIANLEPEEPGTHIRRGVTLRFVPFVGMQAFAFKMAMRRLPDTSYREAMKLPTVVAFDDLPAPISEYFKTRSEFPYHFGPSTDLDLHQNNVQSRFKERSAESEPLAAPALIDGLKEAIGGAKPPSETDFKSGVYDLYGPFDLEDGRLFRGPLLVGGDAKSGRWAYQRVPSSFFAGTPPLLNREVAGPLLEKSGNIIHLPATAKGIDGGEGMSIYFRFGRADFNFGARLGILSVQGLTHNEPIATRVALIRSKEQSFPRAFRASAFLSVEQAPESIQNYFQKEEHFPHILSTVPHPRIF